MPGPGAYDNRLDAGIGYSIGRSKRGDLEKNGLLGPGNYDPKFDVNRMIE